MRVVWLTLLALSACAKKQVVATAPPIAGTKPAPQPTPAAVATTQPVSPQLGVGADLAQQCKLSLTPTEAPEFDYDQFALLPEDRAVLERLATCVTTGPLKGRALQLVGRADPRGTQEYNLGLGDRRASTVSGFLERLGVARTQLATTTRGDLDAHGTDETSWRHDRRVDIILRN
jgi:peptidoglycan-associated lipoprotein